METLELLQGSDEWKAIRGKYLVASEAPVIMGASPHTRRDELLWLKKTGEEKAVAEWTEKFVFKKGHDAEAKARPIAEARLGEDLFPVTGLEEVDGLPLLASFDGLTMFEDNSWEHKYLNEQLADFFEGGNPAHDLPMMYAWQLEHQMLVAGTDSCIFSASKGDEETYHEIVYRSIPERRAQLIEGWKLFNADLAAYEPKVAKSELVGKGPMDLPALRIEITGGVTASNLGRFKEVALDVFAGINTDLKTDDDFANAESTVKWCKSVEDKLEAAKQHALSQTATIDELFRTIDDLREEARKVRLNLDRRVSDRKKEVKIEIAKAAKEEFDKHIAMANKALGGDYMPLIPTDFNTAMKGKRTVATLESAANDELARARIEANRIASRIEENLELIAKLASEHDFLFADKKALVVQHEKTALEAIVKQRIADHDAKLKAEAERLAEQAKRDQERAEAAKQEQAAQQAAASNEPAKSNTPEPALRPGYDNSTPDLPRTTQAAPAASKPQRPDDGDIIATVAEAYGVSEQTALGWIMEMQLRDASTRLASNA